MAVRSCTPLGCKRVLRHLYFTSGRHYWEVLVERMTDPCSVMVGVAPSEAFETGDSSGAVGYAATGVIIHSGVEVCRTQAFAAGDTVGVYLDMNRKQVAFFLNDEAQLNQSQGEEEVTLEDGNVSANTVESELETKIPVYTADTRDISWYSFSSRSMFAVTGVSSNADSLIAVGSEVPDGYR